MFRLHLLEDLEVAPSFEGLPWGKWLSLLFWHKTWLFLSKGEECEGDQTKGCSKMLEVKDLAMDDREYLIEQNLAILGDPDPVGNEEALKKFGQG